MDDPYLIFFAKITIAICLFLWLLAFISLSLSSEIKDIGTAVKTQYSAITPHNHPRPKAEIGRDTGTIAEWTPAYEKREYIYGR